MMEYTIKVGKKCPNGSRTHKHNGVIMCKKNKDKNIFDSKLNPNTIIKTGKRCPNGSITHKLNKSLCVKRTVSLNNKKESKSKESKPKESKPKEIKPKEKTFKLEFLDWIDETKIIESYLKENLTIQSRTDPMIVEFLKKHPNYIDWEQMSRECHESAIPLFTSNKRKIHWDLLSGNKYAMKLLKENLKKVDWGVLSSNESPEAIAMLTERVEHEKTITINYDDDDDREFVNWAELSVNPAAFEILNANPERIVWDVLKSPSVAYKLISEHKELFLKKENIIAFSSSASSNEFFDELFLTDTYRTYNLTLGEILHTISLNTHNEKCLKVMDYLLEMEPEYKEYCDWISLSSNPLAIDLLSNNIDRIDWGYLSSNPAAKSILNNNLDKVNWRLLSSEGGLELMSILENNLNHVVWSELSYNSNAINMLKNNTDKIKWTAFSSNSAIFKR